MKAGRGSDTRKKILDVAEEAFAQRGFAGAHLQYIARRVGVQKTALYYYFPSKAALYEAVLVRMLEAFEDSVSRAVDGDESLVCRFEGLGDALHDLLSSRPNYSQIVIRIFVDRVEIDGKAIGPLIERVVGRLLGFFREGVETNAFARLSARNLFQSLLGILVFHYASGEFGARVLGVDDIFSDEAAAWRRKEVRKLVLRGVLQRQPPEEGA